MSSVCPACGRPFDEGDLKTRQKVVVEGVCPFCQAKVKVRSIHRVDVRLILAAALAIGIFYVAHSYVQIAFFEHAIITKGGPFIIAIAILIVNYVLTQRRIWRGKDWDVALR